jgi:hypothetical protein
MKLGHNLNGRSARFPVRRGVWNLDEDDLLLIALLQDPVYATELLWDDPTNHAYGGCFRWRDYQYDLCRPASPYQGHACARSVGKTESIKAKSFVQPFRRHGQNLLLTAPELIHLLPLTDAVEDRIRDCRLTRDFLDTRGGKTGFTERGWIEVHETVMKDTVDSDGNPDFHYEFYGVHSGARDSGFFKRVGQGAFSMVQITALQRPGWGKAEKDAAKAAYGGTGSPDYRRNILGEPGAAASAFFVISRLIACVDQDRESRYNQHDYAFQELRSEEVEELELPLAEVLDLPAGLKNVWGGMDLGLTNSPTAVMLFTETRVGKQDRLKLVRRLELNRFRARMIVEAWLAIGFAYGTELKGFGVDSTGLGFPIVQAMEDDQGAPEPLLEVTRGYFFNSKVPVGVDESFVTTDQGGRLRDQYGSAVQLETDPLTGITRYVTYMPMIEASTRYLRDFVDTGFMLLPFDTAITTDMMGETQQRVRRVGELRKKPNAFHILDAMRAMAMAYKAADIEEALALPAQAPVLDAAL